MALDTALPPVVAPFERASCLPVFSIRKATIEDLDAIVDIALAAMPLDPQWNWRYPHRGQYPEDERLFTSVKFSEFLLSADRWVVMVVVAPDATGRVAPVAFSVWDLGNVFALVQNTRRAPYSRSPATNPKMPGTVRRDGSPERMDAWAKTTALAKQRLFDARYGSRYFQLQILATLPHWQRKGAATTLCSWGMQLASLLRFNVAVMASPMGKELYTHLGFQKLATVNVGANQNDFGIDLVVMALER